MKGELFATKHPSDESDPPVNAELDAGDGLEGPWDGIGELRYAGRDGRPAAQINVGLRQNWRTIWSVAGLQLLQSTLTVADGAWPTSVRTSSTALGVRLGSRRMIFSTWLKNFATSMRPRSVTPCRSSRVAITIQQSTFRFAYPMEN